MLLYRLSTKQWQDDLIGDSGREVESFWTNGGTPCIYVHGSLANCLIENRMYHTLGNISPEMVMVEYEVPDISVKIFEDSQLPEEWRNSKQPDIARNFGTLQLQTRETLLLAFPSAIMTDQELVYIINPIHPLMKEVRISRIFKPLM